MAMMISSAGDGQEEVISTINTTPLVDVMLMLMLVLLIIFLITIPVVNFSVPVDLPKERNEVRESQPEDIVVSVDSQGNIYWLDSRVENVDALIVKLKKIALLSPQPEVHIRGTGKAPISRSARLFMPASARAL